MSPVTTWSWHGGGPASRPPARCLLLVLELLQHHDCKAGILVVDDALANDWQVLYDLCQLVLPEEILVITNGYSEHADSFAGVPLTLLGRDTVRFRFMR